MPDPELDVHFPRAGIDLSAAFGRQPARPAAGDVYAKSSAGGLNVRTFDAQNRSRGGSRVGLAKYLPVTVTGTTWIIQDLNLLIGAAMGQSSQSGRVVTLVAVSGGNVFSATPGATAWTAAVNATPETPPLNATGVMFSAPNIQLLWFADGTNWCYYNSSTNQVLPWAAAAGKLPVDSANNTPRLICTWRGRTCLSGLLLDPQAIFMSAVGDPTDFDYGPAAVTPGQAVALTAAGLGQVGDMVTGLVPYTDDVLLIGCDHELWMLRGDPMAGGQLDLISDAIGMAWGQAWCKDPYGNIYFFSNRCGIYQLVPGSAPVRISRPVEQLVLAVDTGTNSIRLLWNDRYQGFHVFVSPLVAPAVTTHLFWEMRSNSWWTDRFASPTFDPLCCVTFDGNGPDDRVQLVGSWDGYVRAMSPAATSDDGLPISSSVLIGPILTRTLDDVKVKELQAVLATASGLVTFEVLNGRTAEEAAAGPPVVSGTWDAGRNLTSYINRSAHATYIRLSSTSRWAIESIRAVVEDQGDVRRRGY